MHDKLHIKILLALIIFFVSVAGYYYPVYKKSFPPGADHQNLMEARNFALAGTYKVENSTGVLLSSKNISQSGAEKGIFNPLTAMIYGQMFKLFGFKPNLPLYVSIILFAFFDVLTFLLSARLLGITVGLMSGLASTLMPVMVVGAVHGGFYEWGILFFGFALWFYLGAKNGPFQAGKMRILTAGAFFALAALARNALAISFIPFFLYDFFIHRSYKRSLIFLMPFIVLFGSTLTPYSWLGAPNGYNTNIDQQTFGLIGHFFRDPYTFYFDKDNFIKETYEQGLSRPAVLFATQWGYQVSLLDRLNAYLDSLKFYIKETISFTGLGGPIVLGLMLLGLIRLFYLNKKLLGLCGLWWFFWLGYLVYDKTGNWDHFMEVIFIFSVLTGLGLYRLSEIISNGRSKKLIALSVLILFIGHMAYADKWKIHDVYRSSKEETVLSIVNELNKQKELEGVYAVGIHPSSAYSLNYRLDHDLVYFDPLTVEKLISEKKLKEAFDIYKISAVLGYGEDLTKKIKSQVSVYAAP